jgi:hypothetical protein
MALPTVYSYGSREEEQPRSETDFADMRALLRHPSAPKWMAVVVVVLAVRVGGLHGLLLLVVISIALYALAGRQP